jgi:TonB-linked SusC/RagA family outer membrane protein
MNKEKLKKRARDTIVFIALMFLSVGLYAQALTVKGKVLDGEGYAIAGVAVIVEGTTIGTVTNDEGDYVLNNVPAGSVLQYVLVGYVTATEKATNDRTTINVIMLESTESLEEITVVAFGKQTKTSMVSSVESVNVKELRVPSSNFTTSFSGRIAGMIAYQTSGEPGYDNASFFIRGITTFGTGKVDPLILIDNMEVSASDLSKLHPDDLESFSVLKDASAAALYGARGANGVVLVTTKQGSKGAARLSLRVENAFSSATSKLQMADPITYMEMANEALWTRSNTSNTMNTVYSRAKIEETRLGVNPYVYPAVDWVGMLIKDVTANQRANLSVSGGGDVARYYVAATFSQDNGILKVDNRNNFNNNINVKKYTLRSNINIDITKTTELIVRLHGGFDDYQGPLQGGSDLYKKILKVSPVRFPAYYEPVGVYTNTNHILFGNEDSGGRYLNPYAEMLRGYKNTSSSSLSAQLELKQDLNNWIPGLTARLLANTTRNAGFSQQRAYTPYYYDAVGYDRLTDTYRLTALNSIASSGAEKGTEYLEYIPGSNYVNSAMYGEAAVNWEQKFADKHTVGAMLVGIIRQYTDSNALDPLFDPPQPSLAASLPQRNLGLSGRFTYGYDNRYFAEANFGYNGSEKFDKGHRWGFFPSIGGAWMVSNEAFWKDWKNTVSKLKLRYTYGLVGNDAIGNQRFFYLSNIVINGWTRDAGAGSIYMAGYNNDGFGTDGNGVPYTGVNILAYANPKIGWEVSYKSNIGIEIGLFKDKLEIQADIWNEHRTNILQSRADIAVDMGLWSTPKVNVGEAKGEGVDVSLDYNQAIGKDWWITGRANFTYAHSEYLYYEEPDFVSQGLPWRSKKGRTTTHSEGYVSERLFIDQNEINRAPRQELGSTVEYAAGDIKYKDLDGDGYVNARDMVALGYPVTPEINYGFGVSAGYKNIDVSVFFQGSGRSSFFINPKEMAPFVPSIDLSTGKEMENGLAQFIADDYWTELTQDPYARWPRLANREIQNNTVRSDWWMYTNKYLRFKSFEVGYTLPEKISKKVRMSSARIYVSGTNLLLFSNFKIWDIELGDNGLNYPLQRVFNIGINFGF